MDRVTVLRRAFDAAMTDPEFLAEAEKVGLELNPINGEELQAAVERILAAKPSAIERLQAILKRT